ncbi:MAG: acyltransferase family protein [Verrucomicrobiales bacterium]|nr:acyltransferase family protein [Verrucomicrobiales bacterium]
MSERGPSGSTIAYRPDIDGLRAISVIGVILYHFGLGLPGGFIGVDVFFVISGYLITSIIDREIKAGSFSMLRFWGRRVRRIFPAVTVVVVSTLLAGAIILTPRAFEDLAKSSMAQSLMVSNVYFWKDAGYFSEAAELKPLLHTWSLSVEEQFYIFLPVVLLGLAKIRQQALVPVLWITFTLSLALSIWEVVEKPGATFYLLPTRAWELLAGSLVALSFDRLRISAQVAKSFSSLGLVLILLPMFFYSSRVPFPGASAIPPVLGASLLLLANGKHKTPVGSFLSLRPLVGIGLMSYSLYLWHWPLVSFARHMIIEQGWLEQVTLLILTALLSFLSWKYIENPFRYSNRLKRNRNAFAFALAVTAVLLLTAGSVVFYKGLPQRFDAATLELIEDTHWTGTEYKEEIGDPIGSVRFGDKSSESPDFVVWGDSHAMVLGPLLEELSDEIGLSGVGFITPACPPVPGLWMPRQTSWELAAVLRLNEERLAWILERKARHVILVGRWHAMSGEPAPARFEQQPTVDPRSLMVTDREQTPLDRSQAIGALKRQLQALIAQLDEAGTTVWILSQVPECEPGNFAHEFLLAKRFPSFNPVLPGSGTSQDDYRKDRETTWSMFQTLATQKVRLIDPMDAFFAGSGDLELLESRAYYRDGDHLTRAGVEFYLQDSFAGVLEKVALQ